MSTWIKYTHCKWIRQTQPHIYCNKDSIPTSNTRPPGKFRVMLQSQKYDCGEYQAKQLSCSHVWLTVNLSILIPWTMCCCYSLYNIFTRLWQLLWFTVTRMNVIRIWRRLVGPDPRRKMIVKGRPISTRILTEMDETKMNRKKCEICWQHGHNRNNYFNMSSSQVFP